MARPAGGGGAKGSHAVRGRFRPFPSADRRASGRVALGPLAACSSFLTGETSRPRRRSSRRDRARCFDSGRFVAEIPGSEPPIFGGSVSRFARNGRRLAQNDRRARLPGAAVRPMRGNCRRRSVARNLITFLTPLTRWPRAAMRSRLISLRPLNWRAPAHGCGWLFCRDRACGGITAKLSRPVGACLCG